MQIAAKAPKASQEPQLKKQALDPQNTFEPFVTGLDQFRKAIDHAEKSGESEKHFEDPLKDFLKNKGLFGNHYAINSKSLKGNIAIDLAIHNGAKTDTHVGVLMEVKRPGNAGEMITAEEPNKKALQEAVFYYLWEKAVNANHEIRHVVITNLYEWYLFDADEFNRLFYQDKKLVDYVRRYQDQTLDARNTKELYDFIGKQIADKTDTLTGTYVDIRNYTPGLDEALTKDSSQLSGETLDALANLLKVLSPQHLLKLAPPADSNALNKHFYHELLHILGLEEYAEGNKKLIGRAKNPCHGSILENVLSTLKTVNVLRDHDFAEYGDDADSKLFNIALELCITWLNRILFLKLLESQLKSYHQTGAPFNFMEPGKIREYDDLYNLFFRVMAVTPQAREAHIQEQYPEIPYLNSSLFESTELERKTLQISMLEDNLAMPLHSRSVLKDSNDTTIRAHYQNNRPLQTLDYFMHFLASYDFGTEGVKTLEQEHKPLISASVLGLVFEKINGYREGSFFTPGFITMYMARETLRKTVLDKFNEQYNLNAESITDLSSFMNYRISAREANAVMDDLKVCDPAVGSGHFLVSVLNELIAIKSDLGILLDANEKPIRHYEVKVGNDELEVEDNDHNLFQYTVRYDPETGKRTVNKETHRIQQALFKEKQKLIENCLFGVDINANSVKICRLRLWIELLKNAYYKQEPDSGRFTELETLPNIDINIKEGNSLISRFPLDMDLQDILKKVNRNRKKPISLKDYEMAVHAYKQTDDPEYKQELQDHIRTIKENFREELKGQSPINKKLSKVRGDLTMMENPSVFGEQQYTDKQIEAKRKELEKLEQEKADLENNVIYSNAFEWRFEFPEVLDEKGRFTGFDVVIGNPPYGVQLDDVKIKYFRNNFGSIVGHTEIYYLFIELGVKYLLKPKNLLSYITPNAWLSNKYAKGVRKMLLEEFNLEEIINFNKKFVFEGVQVETSILMVRKGNFTETVLVGQNLQEKYYYNKTSWLTDKNFLINFSENPHIQKLIEKINSAYKKLSTILDISNGCKPYQAGYGANLSGEVQTKDDVKKRIYHSKEKIDKSYKPEIKGKHVNKYTLKEPKEYINWGPWLMSPKNERYFFNKKILIRQIISNTFLATIDDSNSVADQTLYVGILYPNSDVSLEYILGLINSKLYGFYFRKYYAEEDELFPKIKVNELKNLPFPEYNKGLSKVIENNVKEILSKKEKNEKADTSKLEEEIDQKVYEIYGLTKEEVEIVENNFKN